MLIIRAQVIIVLNIMVFLVTRKLIFLERTVLKSTLQKKSLYSFRDIPRFITLH